MWNTAGLIAASIVMAIAFVRSRTRGGFYDADVYGMTARTHRTYALVAGFFALAFAATYALPWRAAPVWLLAAFVPFALLYLTSFLRGAYEDDDDNN